MSVEKMLGSAMPLLKLDKFSHSSDCAYQTGGECDCPARFPLVEDEPTPISLKGVSGPPTSSMADASPWIAIQRYQETEYEHLKWKALLDAHVVRPLDGKAVALVVGSLVLLAFAAGAIFGAWIHG